MYVCCFECYVTIKIISTLNEYFATKLNQFSRTGYLEAGVGASELESGLATGEMILVSLSIGVLVIFFVSEAIGVLTVAPLSKKYL